jgi:integrase
MYAKKAGHLVRLLGAVDVNALNRDNVQGYIYQRLTEGAHRETIRKELCTLNRPLGLAHEPRLLTADPWTLIPKFRSRYVPRDRYLSEEEFRALYAQLEPRRQLWLALAVLTGGHLSEIEALRWEEHVQTDAQRIVLPGTKTQKAQRKVPIPPVLAQLLMEHRQRVGPVVGRWSNVRRDLAAACAHAGIPRVSPNDLHRTFASWLKQRGEDSMVVAQLLGHSSTRMVELVYGRLNEATLQRAVAKLPDLIEPQGEDNGSSWVADSSALLSPMRSMRPGALKENQGVEVPRGGIEPPTRGFSVPCSTN